MGGRSEEMELHLHHETDEAYLVSSDGDEDSAVWLPKSQVKKGRRTGRQDPVYEFDVPVWLAQEEGLI